MNDHGETWPCKTQRKGGTVERSLRWLPNLLSMLRIALVPVWLFTAWQARQSALSGITPSPWPPVLILLAIGASDVIDGAIARRFGLTTNLGATLDAVADKLAQISSVTFLALWGQPAFVAVPLWLLLGLGARDLLLAVGWILVHRQKGSVEAEHRWHGRAATVLLFALIVSALFGAPAQVVTLGSALVLALVIPSTLAYLGQGFRQLRAG